jgi:hypothetical protein
MTNNCLDVDVNVGSSAVRTEPTTMASTSLSLSTALALTVTDPQQSDSESAVDAGDNHNDNIMEAGTAVSPNDDSSSDNDCNNKATITNNNNNHEQKTSFNNIQCVKKQLKQRCTVKLLGGLVLMSVVAFVLIDCTTQRLLFGAVQALIQWMKKEPTKGVFAFIGVYFLGTGECTFSVVTSCVET